MKKILSERCYLNFLSLHIAVSILTSKKHHLQLVDVAEELLIYFVRTAVLLYGRHFASHNVHNLLHLGDDVRKFGVLDNFSCFKFENYLQKLKNLLRKQDKPLQQIVLRLFEMDAAGKKSTNANKNGVCFKNEHALGPLVASSLPRQYSKAIFSNFTLNISEANNCCMLSNGAIVLIEHFSFSKTFNKVSLIKREFKFAKDFFLVPCKSSDIDIYFCNKQLHTLKEYSIKDIFQKMVKLPYENGYVVLPSLLNSYNSKLLNYLKKKIWL